MKISDLPVGKAPDALKYPLFPTEYLAVIWHNWNLISPAKIAEVLETTEKNIVESAEFMGLERDDSQLETFAVRGYLTIIRANWHLLDYDQLLRLLDWTPEKMAFTLKEDDFFWVKLGCLKPRCGKVLYRELTPEERKRTAGIGKETRALRTKLPPKREKPFDFLKKYGAAESFGTAFTGGLRMLYSYSAVYGDPFLDEKTDPYPEGLLKDYAAAGVNAVWLPGLLYTLVPWLGDIGISQNREKRLDGVRRLADRCARYGIRLYLYLNEPRSIPSEAAKKTPFGGAVSACDGSIALCPWVPGLCEALTAGIEQLCREVPSLGGFFTITMSENLTHCLARHASELSTICPRCVKHSPADNVTKVLTAIHEGIVRAGSDAKLIAWTWAWSPSWAPDVLKQLSPDIKIMCVSETNVETDCLGCKGKVRDYSISKPGPGPDAKRLWKFARETGHPCVAKIQVNTTWEMSALPFIPVPFLVEKHLAALRREGIRDFMLSWTLGGSPGGNLPLLDLSVKKLAGKKFGREAPAMLKIWKIFSDAFHKIPFNGTAQIYTSPQNIGPPNPLYPEKTGFEATMVRGFPYDDLECWCGSYPPEVFEEAFRRIADEWKTGLERLERLSDTPAIREQKIMAEAGWCCLRSTYLQIRFIRMRDAGKLLETLPLIREESRLAELLLKTFVSDSRIGFEACNHYFYTENDLMEKILLCSYLEKQFSGK